MMKIFLFLFTLLLAPVLVAAQNDTDEKKIVDIVWLNDGSKLTGTIVKWELDRGMEFQLATGAIITIPKDQIRRVMQDTPFVAGTADRRERVPYVPKPYDFKEKGWYQNTSGFLNVSNLGGAGISHVMGYRFSRMLGIGFGIGIETNDFTAYRNIMPVFVEARGFLLPKKITPYYALKVGYGFGMANEINGTLEAKGGLHISPEIGVRFGAGDVSYYLGLEYKLQNATFVWNGWDFSGNTRVTDKVSYRRIELR
ncbi:MAG TPA: hypothetical protein VMZ69_07835, partial [Saprospiraceae bacterium]|nr:hypothetical protein [Saprospiraceae bacterium]